MSLDAPFQLIVANLTWNGHLHLVACGKSLIPGAELRSVIAPRLIGEPEVHIDKQAGERNRADTEMPVIAMAAGLELVEELPGLGQ